MSQSITKKFTQLQNVTNLLFAPPTDAASTAALPAATLLPPQLLQAEPGLTGSAGPGPGGPRH